jgi:chaperonin GroEL
MKRPAEGSGSPPVSCDRYNARTDQYKDLVGSGVIDPNKVTRTALQNAASIAGLLLTAESVVVERSEKDKPSMPGGGGGMDGMY